MHPFLACRAIHSKLQRSGEKGGCDWWIIRGAGSPIKLSPLFSRFSSTIGLDVRAPKKERKNSNNNGHPWEKNKPPELLLVFPLQGLSQHGRWARKCSTSSESRERERGRENGKAGTKREEKRLPTTTIRWATASEADNRSFSESAQ